MNQHNTSPQSGSGEQPEGGSKNIVFIIIALIGIVAIALMFTAGGRDADAPTDEENDVTEEEVVENDENDTEENGDAEAPTPAPEPTTETISAYFIRVVDGQEEFVRVTRTIPAVPGIARASVGQLLQGPTESEVDEGLGTAIPAGVELQDIRIENGVAFVDFNQALQEDVAGSAMVTAIRSQIERTLTQFPTVSSVVISIDGQTEDILQP